MYNSMIIEERSLLLFKEKYYDYQRYRRRKVDEKSCVTFLLCDPGCYVQRT